MRKCLRVTAADGVRIYAAGGLSVAHASMSACETPQKRKQLIQCIHKEALADI